MVSPFPEGRDLGMGIRYKRKCGREKFRKVPYYIKKQKT